MFKKIINKVVGIRFVLAVFVSALGLSLLTTAPIAAATDCTWTDASHISCNIDGVQETFTQQNINGNDMTLGGIFNTVCNAQDTLDVNPYKTTTTVNARLQRSQAVGRSSSCNPVNKTLTLDKSFNDGGVASGGGASDQGQACGISDNDSLRWILCPVIWMVQKAIDALTGFLQTFLYTPTDQIFAPDSGLQGAYNSFRDLGIGLLVIALLVMVGSQAAGMEIFAAYTIRRALPRIVIAMIGIVAAWPLLQFAVTLSNDLGSWIAQLLSDVVSGSSAGAPLSAYAPGGITGLIALGGVAAVGAIFSVGIMVSLMGTALLALLVGVLILALRQMVIIVCIIMAPFAIAAAVVPGTEKLWHFWRDSFIGALLMFPIIMAFLGAGQALSVIAGRAAGPVGQASAAQGNAWDFLAVIAPIAALASVPFAFRMVSGILGTLHGLVTNSKLHQGAFGALSGYRANKAGQRLDAAKRGNFLRTGTFGSGRFGKFMDERAKGWSRRAQTGTLLASEPFNKGRRQALRRNTTQGLAAEAGEKDADVNSFRNNDAFVDAAIGGKDGTGDITQEGVKQALLNKGYSEATATQVAGSITRARRNLGENVFMATMATAQAATGTGYDDYADMAVTIARAARDPSTGKVDRNLANNMLGQMRGMANQSGRHDLGGASFSLSSQELDKVMDSLDAGEDVATARSKVDIRAVKRDVLLNNDAVTLGRDRERVLRSLLGTNEDADPVKRANQNQGGMTEYVQELEAGRGATVQQIQRIQTELSRPNITNEQRLDLTVKLQKQEQKMQDLAAVPIAISKAHQAVDFYAAPSRSMATGEAQRIITPQIERLQAEAAPPPPPAPAQQQIIVTNSSGQQTGVQPVAPPQAGGPAPVGPLPRDPITGIPQRRAETADIDTYRQYGGGGRGRRGGDPWDQNLQQPS